MDCDETFNYIEPLHMLVYGRGLQTWEYSPEYSLRSYFFLLIHAAFAYLARLIGLEAQFGKIGVFYFIRAWTAFFSSLCQAILVSSVSRRFGRRTSNVFLVFILFGAGMSHAAHSVLPQSFTMNTLMLAFAAWLDTEPAELFARLIAAAALKSEDGERRHGGSDAPSPSPQAAVSSAGVKDNAIRMAMEANAIGLEFASMSSVGPVPGTHGVTSTKETRSRGSSAADLVGPKHGLDSAEVSQAAAYADLIVAHNYVIPSEGPLSVKAQTRRVELSYLRVVFWVAVSGLLGWPFVALLVLPVVIDVLRAYLPCDVALPCRCTSRRNAVASPTDPVASHATPHTAAPGAPTLPGKTNQLSLSRQSSGSSDSSGPYSRRAPGANSRGIATVPAIGDDDSSVHSPASLSASAAESSSAFHALPAAPILPSSPRPISLCAAAAIFPYPAALPQRLLPPLERLKALFRLLLFAIFCAFAILLPSIAIDAMYYRRMPVVAIWNIAKYNSNPGGDDSDRSAGQQLYGTEPASYYLVNLLLNFNLAVPLALLHLAFALVACASLFCLPRFLAELFAAITCNVPSSPAFAGGASAQSPDKLREIAGAQAFARARNRLLGQLVAVSPLYIWLLVMTPQPHKEERFLYVVYPLIALAAAFGLELVMDIVQTIVDKLAQCSERSHRDKEKEKEKDVPSSSSSNTHALLGSSGCGAMWNFLEQQFFALAPSPSRSNNRGRFAKLWGRTAWISVCIIALFYMALSVSRSLALTYGYQAPTLAFMSLSAMSYAQTNRAIDMFLDADPETKADTTQPANAAYSNQPIYPSLNSIEAQPRRKLLGEGSTVSPTAGSLVVRSVEQLIALMKASTLRGLHPRGYALATLSQHASARARAYIDYDPLEFVRTQAPEFVPTLAKYLAEDSSATSTKGTLTTEERMTLIAQATILRACVGKDWFRFPSSFFLPEAQWIEVALSAKELQEYMKWWQSENVKYWTSLGGEKSGLVQPHARYAVQTKDSPLPPPGFGQGVLVPMDNAASGIAQTVVSNVIDDSQESKQQRQKRGVFQVLLRPRIDLDFILSDFRGILPQHFNANILDGIPAATSAIPPFMNELNQREPTRYVPVESCHYVVDGDIGQDRTNPEDAWGSQVPAVTQGPSTVTGSDGQHVRIVREADGAEWELVYSVPFVDAERSNRFARAFYIPQWIVKNAKIPFNVWRRVPKVLV